MATSLMTPTLNFISASREIDNMDNFVNYDSPEFKVIKHVDTLIKRSELHRSKFSVFWDPAMRMYLPQNMKGIPNTGQPAPSTLDEQMFLSDALVFRMVETVVGILSDNRPSVTIIPNSNNDEDLGKAQQLQKITEFLWDEWDMTESKLPLLIRYGEIYGMAFVKLCYNPSKSREYGGDLDCIIIPASNMHFDGSVDNVMNSEFFIWEQMVPEDYVKRRYPNTKKIQFSGISVGDSTNRSTDFLGTNSAIGNFHGAGSMATGDLDVHFIDSPVHDLQGENLYTGRGKQVLLREAWFKDYALEEYAIEGKKRVKATDPNTGEVLYKTLTDRPIFVTQKYKLYGMRYKYPNNNWRLVIICNNKVLKDIPSPYEHGMAPFVSYINIDIGEGWGLSTIPYVAEVNLAVDRLISLVLEHAYYSSNPAWIIDDGAVEFEDDITNAIGRIIRKAPGSDVHREKGPDLPDYLFPLISFLKSSEQDTFGITDTVTGGKAGVHSGTQYESMQEAAQIRLRLKMRSLESTIKRIGRMALSLIRQFYSKSRTFRISGAESKPEIFDFSSKGLSGTWDMRLSIGTRLPVSRLQAMQQDIQLFQLGAIDQEELLKGFDKPNWKEIIDRMERRAKEAQNAQNMAAIAQEAQKGAEEVKTSSGGNANLPPLPLGKKRKDVVGRFAAGGRPAQSVGRIAPMDFTSFANSGGGQKLLNLLG